MANEHVYIYLLVDPRSHYVCYVGKTSWPERRYAQHLEDDSNTPKTRWIHELTASGYEPQMVVVERCPPTRWPEREEAWIQIGKQLGWPLTNIVGVETTYTTGKPSSKRKLTPKQKARMLARSPVVKAGTRAVVFSLARRILGRR